MLARLLRCLLLALCLLGATLGYYWQPLAASPVSNAWVLALLSPLAFLAIIVGVTAVRSRAPGEPAGMWWRALWGEYWASVLVFMLRQPWTTGTPSILQAAPAASNAQRVPIVLVHGYMCNHRTWDTLIPALRAQGHTVLAVNLEPLFTSIDAYASHIEAAVRQLLQHTGATQVALVGHSMGGVAIRG